MPLPLPGTIILAFLVSGVAGALVFTGYRAVETIGPELEPNDFLPALPPNPPVPRFVIEKPELMEDFTGE